jgi:glycosyltransferase involved in cell wall biosynthesis
MLEHYFYPWADAIVAVSKGVADDLAGAARLPRDRIKVIYNPVVTEVLFRKAEEPLEHPWFLPGCPPVILGVGRLTAAKDFPTLTRAFARVRESQSARLLILGEGKERDSLEKLVRELGLERDVSMPGFVDNPYAYMRRSSLFVLSSAWEGLPTVLIEAMACGCQVISTNCPSGPEEILDGGKYGELVRVGDAEAMSSAMLRALSNIPKRVTLKWVDQFRSETVICQYLNCILDDSSATRNTIEQNQ